MIWHATASSLASQQDRDQAEALENAGIAETFRFSSDQSSDITELLKDMEPFKAFMPATPSQPQVSLRRPLLEGAGGRKRSEPEEDSQLPTHLQANPHEQPRKEAFQTARSKLAADVKKSGHSQGMDPAAMFTAGNEAGPGGAPKAAGLARPPNSKRGVRGGFVPPFARKAAEATGAAIEAGTLSAKTIEMLGGSDGQLPEALQKLDPNILELVCNEIMDSSSLVQWDDIAGQEHAKAMVQEVVVWPMLNPHLFQGARAPPRGLLLFGPPGTGKTLIGKAIASNISATFFNISSSSLVSKWIGEGEKMVRALFAVAGHLQPAVIFIDEIDSILTARKAEGEHEASRRLKTEMLVQMDGCSPDSSERRVLLVGATNRPQELDEAARRRMPKQLYIPLPCAAARRQMVDRQLGCLGAVKASLSEADLGKLVGKTDGYSGSDMKNLIQEACQGPVREAVARHGSAIAQISESDLRPVLLKDFQMATRAQRASVEPSEIAQYELYNSRHGAHFAKTTDVAMEEEDW
ncbi:hypothetical protein WJX84_000805 [Apatococcus fuscideae]|uniref:AAA+ ATPase domain-containing protein n=1 Tax=Apatococcus fuscideae TaxID=2026836 RepID=A0AAW1SZF3_9CHLO